MIIPPTHNSHNTRQSFTHNDYNFLSNMLKLPYLKTTPKTTPVISLSSKWETCDL